MCRELLGLHLAGLVGLGNVQWERDPPSSEANRANRLDSQWLPDRKHGCIWVTVTEDLSGGGEGRRGTLGSVIGEKDRHEALLPDDERDVYGVVLIARQRFASPT